jgi:perosamine synthetase
MKQAAAQGQPPLSNNIRKGIDQMSTSAESVEQVQEDFIPLCVPEIRGNEWQYIKDCLDTNFVSSVGVYVNRFERMVAGYVGTSHGVATASGTAALHVALLVAGVEPDDEVLVSALTFIAPANAIRYVGAWPVFIDADPTYWQMDEQKVVNFLEQECRWANSELRNKTSGRRIKAILPVHILGHPVDMRRILELAQKYDLRVVEDATESLGAKYRERMVGHLGDIGCFSFNGNKTITAGGGGMMCIDDQEWAKHAKYLSTQARDDTQEYIHENIGYNYRLTNIQAALGVAQMEKLDEYIGIKREIAQRYTSALTGTPGITCAQEAPWAFSTFWQYTILIDEERTRINSRQVIHELGQRNIQARPLWGPINEQRPYRDCQAYQIEVTPRLYREALSLPSSVGLREADQTRVVAAVRDILEA